MDQLTRYIFRHSQAVAFFVAAALTAAAWLIQSLKLIDLMVNHGVGVGLFLELLVLALPQLLQLVLPIACFVGVLFTYGKFIAESELIVMRACGMSQWRLAWPALIVAGVGTLVMLSLSIYFLPASRNAFKDLQFKIRNQFTSVILQDGTFNVVSDTLTVYVHERDASGDLQGLLIEDRRDPKKPVILTAERGATVQVDGTPRVLMINGTREVWDTDKRQLSVLTFDRNSLNLDDFRDTPGARIAQPDERYLPELFDPSDVADNPALYTKLIVEGHNRLIGPFECLAFIMVALASLLTGELNRRGQMKRMIVAWAVVAGLEVASIGAVNLAGRSLHAVPLMYLVVIVPIVVSSMLMFGGRHAATRRPIRLGPEAQA
jgi:lipopolysaccharide export system permease protein